jgi:hypothetical protein
MAKTSKVVKNEQRREIVARYAARRRELKAVIANPRTTPVAREEAARALRALPRDAHPQPVPDDRPAARLPPAVRPGAHDVPGDGPVGPHPRRAQGELVTARRT